MASRKLPEGDPLFLQSQKGPHQKGGGVAVSAVDVLAGVPAVKAGDRQRPGRPARGHRCGGRRRGEFHRLAAAAAAEDLLFIRVVQIDEIRGPDLADIKAARTGEVLLLGGGEQYLQLGVGQLWVGQSGHGKGHTDSVVCTQRGPSAGGDPIPLDLPLDGVAVKVVLYMGRLFTHHVHVGLKHDAGGSFIPGGRRLADENILGRILLHVQPVVLSPMKQIVADLTLTQAGARNLAQLMEIAEYRFLQERFLFGSHCADLLLCGVLLIRNYQG